MPVSGVVARIQGSASTIAATLDAIVARPSFTLGDEGQSGRHPLVLETDDSQASESELRWLEQQAGVELVEIVYVDFAEQIP